MRNTLAHLRELLVAVELYVVPALRAGKAEALRRAVEILGLAGEAERLRRRVREIDDSIEFTASDEQFERLADARERYAVAARGLRAACATLVDDEDAAREDSDLLEGKRVPVEESPALTGSDGRKFPETVDASVWAAQFVRRFRTVDEGDALGWFANAIESGKAVGREIERVVAQTPPPPRAPDEIPESLYQAAYDYGRAPLTDTVTPRRLREAVAAHVEERVRAALEEQRAQFDETLREAGRKAAEERTRSVGELTIPPPPPPTACRFCRFADAGEPLMQCRRRAPRWDPVTGAGTFPRVHVTDWCGEFEARVDG